MTKRQRSAEKEAFWRLAFEEQRRSGLSIQAFCRREGLSPASFYGWRRELRRRDAESACSASAASELVPVAVVDSAPARHGEPVAEALEVVTPSGFTLRFPATLGAGQLEVVLGVILQSRGTTAC